MGLTDPSLYRILPTALIPSIMAIRMRHQFAIMDTIAALHTTEEEGGEEDTISSNIIIPRTITLRLRPPRGSTTRQGIIPPPGGDRRTQSKPVILKAMNHGSSRSHPPAVAGTDMGTTKSK